MITNQPPVIEISLSKGKIVKLFFFSLLFVAVGTWILIAQPSSSNFLLNNPVLRNIAGAGSALMGLAGVLFFVRKLFVKEPAFVIDETGFTDRSGAVAAGRINWADVASIFEKSIQVSIASKQRFIVIMLKDPEAYMAQQPGKMKQRLMQANTRYSGSPVNISVNAMAISFEELKALLQQRLEAFKSSEVSK
ncbi:MAG: STM3941 family protein [Chitinophagaceae bacterium]